MLTNELLQSWNCLTKEELNEFYNSQFEPMEFPWLSDVRKQIEKAYDVKVMTILYELRGSTHEFTLYFYSCGENDKIPLVDGQAYWCGHCAEIENMISEHLKCNETIRCRLTYCSFEQSAKRYLFGLLCRNDTIRNKAMSLFERLEPTYVTFETLGLSPIICVLETIEQARDFLLSEYCKTVRKECFDLLNPYDEYNVLKENDIIIFVDYKENKEKMSMYGLWVRELPIDELEKYEKSLIG